MSNDSQAERVANALANLKRLERETAEAKAYLAREAEGFPPIQPTKKRPESYWRERGYEFYYCGGCSHRFFERGMVPAMVARVGSCHWCHVE